MKIFKNNKKGFTLVELLVVIAVLGIMAGIGLNSMSGITTIFKQRADEKTCDQIARVIEVRLLAGEFQDEVRTLDPNNQDQVFYLTGEDVEEFNRTASQTDGKHFRAKVAKYYVQDSNNSSKRYENLQITFYTEDGTFADYTVKNVAFWPIN